MPTHLADRSIANDMAKQIRKQAGPRIRAEIRSAALSQYPKEGG
jgi:hypothetical protein